MTWNVITAPNMDRRFGLPAVPDESIDAIVQDPPAGISFMGKEWDSNKGGREIWIDWLFNIMTQCFRVLKPGGHMLVWALPRTSHWTATAIEDAGFEVRDVVHHHFGNGFPKSLDVSKAIDKALGAEREVIGPNPNHRPESGVSYEGVYAGGNTGAADLTAAGSDEAATWEGWGTALKPSTEHWILARKPIDKNIARNVLLYGTGAINVNGCRIGSDDTRAPTSENALGQMNDDGWQPRRVVAGSEAGRWPANLILSHGPDCQPVGVRRIRGDRREGSQGSRPAGFMNVGADAGDDKPSGPLYGDESVVAWKCGIRCPVAEIDLQSGVSASTAAVRRNQYEAVNTFGSGNARDVFSPHSDSGGASRFFTTFRYEAKPSRGERDAGLDGFEQLTGGEATGRKDGSKGLKNPRAGAGRGGGSKNKHPTVKSIGLMSWLVRLITPPGGVVLDPFCGSGSTGCAAVIEGFDFLGFEMDQGFADIARARISFWEQWETEQAPLLKAAGVDGKNRREQLDLIERMKIAVEGMGGGGDDEASDDETEVDDA